MHPLSERFGCLLMSDHMDAMRALKALKLSILTLDKTIYQASNRNKR